MTTKPPVSEWIRFNDAVALVYRDTLCARGEDKPALVAELADGSISARRKQWRLDDSPHKSKHMILPSNFWTDDWENKLYAHDDTELVVEVEVNHRELRSWLKGSRGGKRGRPYFYSRDEFRAEAIRRIEERKFPFKKTTLKDEMEAWCKEHWDYVPGETWMKDRVLELFNEQKGR